MKAKKIVKKSDIYLALAAMALLGAYVLVMNGEFTGFAATNASPQALIANSGAYSVGQPIATSASLHIGTKIKDDPAFEVRFLRVEKASQFTLQFFHDSSVAQPATVSGISSYALSNRNPAPFEVVTLIVPLTSGKVPKFTLRVGSASEEFSFGESSFGGQGFSAQQIGLDNCTTISASGNYQLTGSVSSGNTCMNITADNVNLNCQGLMMRYGSGASGTFGVASEGRRNVTVRNCIIIDTNSSGSLGIAINLSFVNNATVINNTIQTNGTDKNYGILLLFTHNSTVANNTIMTNGTSSENFGILLLDSDSNHIANNSIRTNGTSFWNGGIRLWATDSGTPSSKRNLVENNVIQTSVGNGIETILSAGFNTIRNNVIRTFNGDGIDCSGGTIFNNTFANNTIFTNGTSAGNTGIFIASGCTDFNATGNNITTDGASSNTGIEFQAVGTNNAIIAHNVIRTNGFSGGDNDGIDIGSPISLNTFTRNNITTNGSGDNNHGIHIGSSGTPAVNAFTLNFISAGGSGSNNYGIFFDQSAANNVSDNIIRTTGTTANYGFRLNPSAGGDRLKGNNITTSGASSFGLLLSNSNTAGINNTILNNPVEWISANFSVNNITNTSFITPNGSIRIPGSFRINASSGTEITRARLDITSNRAFLNSTNLTFLNQPGVIELTALAFSDPQPTVDFNDDGLFEACGAPNCTEVSFAGGTFVYNVSGFTAYASQESGGTNITLSKSDSPDPVISNNLLQYFIVINVTAGNATNITLVDTYAPQVRFNTSSPAPTVANGTFFIGNLSNGTYVQVNITVLVLNVSNGTRINNTANITYLDLASASQSLQVRENTTVLAPSSVLGNNPGITQTQFACGNLTSNTVLAADFTSLYSCFSFAADNIFLDCNGHTITYGTAGGDASYGVYSSRSGTTIRNCIIRKPTTSGSYGIAIYIGGTSAGVILNNTLMPSGTFNNYGIFLESSSSFNITNNTIITSGLNTSSIGFGNIGIDLWAIPLGSGSNNNIIENNNISTSGQDHNWGIYINGSTGNVVRNNTVVANGTSTRNFGIHLRNSASNSLIGNRIATGGTDAAGSMWSGSAEWGGSTAVSVISPGIRFDFASNSNVIANNTIRTAGRSTGASTRNSGIHLISGPSSNTVIGNVIFTNGSGEDIGIRLETSANSNIVSSNRITTNSSASSDHGIYITSSSGNQISGNTISTDGCNVSCGVSNDGIVLNAASSSAISGNNITTYGGTSNVGIYLAGASASNTITNNTIRTGGSSSDNNGITFTDSGTVSNIAENNTISTSGTQDNWGISFSYDNNAAKGNVIRTSGSLTTGGNDGIGFTGAGSSAAENNIATNNEIIVGGTGIGEGIVFGGIANNNTALNNSIRFETADLAGNAGVSIEDSAYNNTVINNTILINSTRNSFGIRTQSPTATFFDTKIINNTITVIGNETGNAGIRIHGGSCGACGDSGVTGMFIIGNIIRVNGTTGSTGITFESNAPSRPVSSNVIANNSITITSNDTAYGVHLLSNSAVGILSQNSISGNTIEARGPDRNNHGIFLQFSGVSGTTIRGNFITANGTGSDNGIRLQSITTSRIESNTVRTLGAGGENDGIYLISSTSNNITGNTILTNETNSDGIVISEGSSNGIMLNTINASGSNSDAITINASGGNTIASNSMLVFTRYGLNLIRSLTTFINTSFFPTGSSSLVINETSGSIEFRQSVNFSLGAMLSNISNISSNRIFINTTNTTGGQLNRSAQLVLRGLALLNPFPIVDFEDDGTFTTCTAPQCTTVSSVAGMLVFNVSSFTTYAASGILNITSCGAINQSAQLTSNVISNGTCFTINANNVDFDCNGFSILYNLNGSDNSNGVAAIGRDNVTVRNCIIRDVNASGQRGFGINFTNTNSSFALNNTIITNGTSEPYGVFVDGSANYNSIINNTIRTNGTSDAFGILLSPASNSNVTGNFIETNGTSSNHGVRLESTLNSFITGNTIRTRGVGSDHVGIAVFSGSHGNTVTDNNISTNGTTNNIGIFISTSSNNSVAGNIIDAAGNETDNYGIEVFSSEFDNNVTGNTITATAKGSQGIGIVINAASRSRVVNNTVRTGGDAFNAGILIQDGHNSTFENNTIRTTGTNNSFGIWMISLSSRNNITRNNITAGGQSFSHGIVLSRAFDTRLDYNAITTNGTLSYGVNIFNANSSLFTNTIFNNPSDWLNASGNTFNNFTNTTFSADNGSIRIEQLFNFNGSAEVPKQNLNITFNRTFLSSAALQFLNVSSQITLRGLPFAEADPIVDFEDDGTFAACNPPQCIELSFASGVFVFNVSTWTAYASTGSTCSITGSSVNGTTCQDSNITNSTKTNVTIIGSSNLNCIVINSTETNTQCTNSNINGSVITNSTVNSCTIINSTVTSSNKANCTIINSVVINSTNVNATIINSNETNSLDNFTIVTGSNITGSTKVNSQINSSVIENSTLENCIVINSTVTNSVKVNCTIINSVILNSTNRNSNITNSNETNSLDNSTTVVGSSIVSSTKVNSTINGSTVANSTVINSNVTNSTLNGTVKTGSSNTNCTIFNTNETNSQCTSASINNSVISSCVIINSTVVNSNKANCTIINSVVVGSTNNNATIIGSNETNSLDNGTTVTGSNIVSSTKVNSTINGSLVTNSTIIGSNATNSTINGTIKVGSSNTNCNIFNSSETGSQCQNSNINSSIISSCTIINSTIINSVKTNCTIINSIIISSNNTGSTITGSNETNSVDTGTEVTGSNITGSVKAGSEINSSVITSSNITNSTIINSNATNSNLTNCIVINSTVIGLNISGCTFINVLAVPIFGVNITTSATSGSAVEGSSVTYTITVGNNGTLLATYNITANNTDGANTVTLSQSSVTLPPGATASITLTVGHSSTGSFTVNVTATLSTNSSITATTPVITTTFTAAPGAAPAAAGGGGAAAPIVVPQLTEKANISFIPANGCGQANFTKYEGLAIKEIVLCSRATARNVELTVTRILFTTPPLDLPPITYMPLAISADRINETDITSVTYLYAVNDSWIAQRALRIDMLRRVGSNWITLGARYVSEEGEFVFYRTTSPGLTLYAITGEGATCPACDAPGEWGACQNGQQSRTEHVCGKITNYLCEARTETRACQACPVCPPESTGACIEGRQTRTTYTCGADTGYQCAPESAQVACAVPLTDEQIALILRAIGIVVVGAAAVMLVLAVRAILRRRKYALPRVAPHAPPAPPEAPEEVPEKAPEAPKEERPMPVPVPKPKEMPEKVHEEAHPRRLRMECEVCGKPQTMVHTCDECDRQLCMEHIEILRGKMYCPDHAKSAAKNQNKGKK